MDRKISLESKLTCRSDKMFTSSPPRSWHWPGGWPRPCLPPGRTRRPLTTAGSGRHARDDRGPPGRACSRRPPLLCSSLFHTSCCLPSPCLLLKLLVACSTNENNTIFSPLGLTSKPAHLTGTHFLEKLSDSLCFGMKKICWISIPKDGQIEPEAPVTKQPWGHDMDVNHLVLLSD